MSAKLEWSCEWMSIALLRVHLAMAYADKPMNMAQQNTLLIKSLRDIAKNKPLTGTARSLLYRIVATIQQLSGKQPMAYCHQIYDEAYALMQRSSHKIRTKNRLLNALEELRVAGFHVNTAITDSYDDVANNVIYILDEHMKLSFDEEGNNIGFCSILVRGDHQKVINVCYQHEILLTQIEQVKVDGSFNTHFQLFDKRHHLKHCLVKAA
jgi:hypothetical protein